MIFWSPNRIDWVFNGFCGFSRFFAIFWVKMWKNHQNFFFKKSIFFFRFFEKCAKSFLDIIYGLEMGFKPFEGDFYAIFDGIYIIWTNFKKIVFLEKMHFLRFFGQNPNFKKLPFWLQKGIKKLKFFRIQKLGL